MRQKLIRFLHHRRHLHGSGTWHTLVTTKLQPCSCASIWLYRALARAPGGCRAVLSCWWPHRGHLLCAAILPQQYSNKGVPVFCKLCLGLEARSSIQGIWIIAIHTTGLEFEVVNKLHSQDKAFPYLFWFSFHCVLSYNCKKCKISLQGTIFYV